MKQRRDELLALSKKVVGLLQQRGLTCTTVESCTAGGVSYAISHTPGASSVMRQSSVVYCNEAKIALGVPREIIDIYTVYSEDTARAMALAGLDAANADIAVGVTGSISRVDPFNQENSEPGVIYVAVAQRRKKRARYAIASRKLVFDAGERWQIQEGAVIAALDLVLSVLKQGRQGVRQ